MREEVICGLCDLRFVPERENEDALIEKKRNFDDMPLDQMVLVCTDCFNKIMAWAVETGLHKNEWERVE